MPRRSSGGRSARPVPHPVHAPAPAPARPVPRPAPTQNSSDGSLFGGIARGIQLGIGIAIANAVLGPRTVEQEHKAVVWQADSSGSDACGLHSKALQDCMNSNGTDISKCQLYMDKLAECKRNSGSGTNISNYCQFYMDKLAECKGNSGSVMSS
ncbi:uncharacterized protein [Henckelia pumila]|uniref:uncharacterized protein n=1 Tax=Henckelia pumila TaxID=405737 RepID=UPI003C6E8343